MSLNVLEEIDQGLFDVQSVTFIGGIGQSRQVDIVRINSILFWFNDTRHFNKR